MTEMFGEAWPPMSVPDLAPDDDNDDSHQCTLKTKQTESFFANRLNDHRKYAIMIVTS